ncbi:MAG TPA: TRAP transporter small permease [Syntrophorhabdaceae bacterium]|nr:TRAP transporter small permease [Syntrophorhabdaceae bacterium]
MLGRYLFNHPLMWTVEISEYLQIYFVFLSAAWVLRQKGHVALDIAVNRFGPSWKRTCAVITDILGVAVATALSVFSGIITYEQMMLGTPVIKTLEVPKWIVIMPIPAGMLLLAIEFLVRLFAHIRQGE